MKIYDQLEKLVTSKVRLKIVFYFFQNQDAEIHLRAIVREVEEEINAVRRELNRMEKIGLLEAKKQGNRKVFSLNTQFVFFDELLALTLKSNGLGLDVLENQHKIGELEFAVLAQGYTRSKPVGKHKMDLVLVGNGLNEAEIKRIIDRQEKYLGRDIYYAILDKKDFDMRKTRRDLFMQELLMQELVVLVGDRAKLVEGIH